MMQRLANNCKGLQGADQMKDYLFIDTTPSEEQCSQVGEEDYHAKARAEAKRMLAQIDKHYPLPNDATMGYTTVAIESHDFGAYFQIKIVFDDECEHSINWAFSIEGDELGALRYWDEEIKTDFTRAKTPQELVQRFANA
jgi:hypothetical protein